MSEVWIPFSHIIGNIYVGDHIGSRDGNFMFEKEIKLVVNCTEDFPNCFEGYRNQGMTYYNISLPDDGTPDTNNKMLEHCRKLIPMIKECDMELKKGVFIHCYYGASRSASVCVAYIMMEYGMSMQNAIQLVKKQRPNALRWYNFLPMFHAISGKDGSEAIQVFPDVWVGGHIDALIDNFMIEKKIKLIVNFVEGFHNKYADSNLKIQYFNVKNGMDANVVFQEIDKMKPVFIHAVDPMLPFHNVLFQYVRYSCFKAQITLPV